MQHSTYLILTYWPLVLTFENSNSKRIENDMSWAFPCSFSNPVQRASSIKRCRPPWDFLFLILVLCQHWMGWATEGPQKKEPKKIKKKNTKTGEENKARSRPQTIAEEKLHQIPEAERKLHNLTQEEAVTKHNTEKETMRFSWRRG